MLLLLKPTLPGRCSAAYGSAGVFTTASSSKPVLRTQASSRQYVALSGSRSSSAWTNSARHLSSQVGLPSRVITGAGGR
jgi:hypothetical protein